MSDLIDWPMPQQPLKFLPGDMLSDAELVARNMEIEEAKLQDVDSFSNWLYSHCGHTEPVTFGYVPNDDVRFDAFLSVLDVPQLIAYAIQYGCGSPKRAGQAMARVAELYCKESGR